MEHQGVCLVRRGGAQQMEAELARAGDRWKMRNNVNIKPVSALFTAIVTPVTHIITINTGYCIQLAGHFYCSGDHNTIFIAHPNAGTRRIAGKLSLWHRADGQYAR